MLLLVLAFAALIGTQTLAFAAAPAVTGVSPPSGPAGTVVTVTGSGFIGATSVSFGGTTATPSTVTDTQITVTAPAHALGQVDVQVTTPAGTSPVVATDKFTYTAPPPAVTGVSPVSGSAGTVVTVTGTGFTGATSVSFSGALATPVVTSDTQLTVTAPAHVPGPVDVQVMTPAGTSPIVAADRFTYLNPAVPTVTGVSPASGPAGTTVTVTGTAFSGATSVSFGGTMATPTVTSDTQLTATAPAHALGQVDVQVTTPSGTSPVAAADKFTYTGGVPVVTGVSPASGPAGTVVTITGSGFTGATSVNFGGAATVPTSVTDTQITATAPAHALGQVDVLVTTPGGTSAAVAADKFTYVAAGTPVVTGINPTSGVAGTVVTITGTGFTGATAVSFGGSMAAPTVVSDTQITVTAPGHAAGVVDVTVTNAVGTSAVTPAAQFTYTASSTPVITGVAPASGPVTGGNAVVITGSAFTGVTSVMFGTLAAAFTINSDTQITATAPAATAPGQVNVQVSTATNNSANSAASRYTYLSGNPAITGLNPAFGPNSGGIAVVITGTGFTGTTGVTFGGTAASFSVNSDTQITVVSPFHIVGTVDVVVTTLTGVSANTAADNFTYMQDFCPVIPLWVNDLAYGSPGGGFYWDQVSGLVWTAQRDWHLFSPQPARVWEPLWVNALSYGSPGGGFYWDPVSGLVWTAQRDWHLYAPEQCIPRP